MSGLPAPVGEPQVIFFTRKGCTLCDKIWPHLEAQCLALGLSLASIDVDSSEELKSRHGDWVPVIAIGGRERLRGPISPVWLARELAAFAESRPQATPLPEIPTIRVGVAIVIDPEGRILVNKRPEGSYFGGWWEWPGGKCGMGERPRDCAMRELREEIGVAATDWRLFDRRVSVYPGRRVKLWFYRAKLDPMTRPHEQALEHQWLLPADILKLKFLEANLPVLEMLKQQAGV